MDVEHKDRGLQRMESDPEYTAGYSSAIVRAFRKRMQLIRASLDERDLYAMKSLHFEKLKGDRSHQRSIRINGYSETGVGFDHFGH